jgi:cell division transport system permease protein
MLDRIEFLLSETFNALRRNTWMSFAAISTSCMALFLLGGMTFAYVGINRYAATLPDKFEMRVFMKADTSPEAVLKIRDRISTMEGVNQAELISKAEAWKRMRTEMPELTTGIDNPLPDMINVTLSDLDKADTVAGAIKKQPEIEKDGVKYLSKEREVLSQVLLMLRWIGLVMGGLMLLTAGVLIYNAIRMTIVARRRETRIMRLVGATNFTVLFPLVLEGIIHGLCGGFLASILILLAHGGLKKLLTGVIEFVQIGNLAPGSVFPMIVGLGALYGLICSLIAVRDPKKVDV